MSTSTNGNLHAAKRAKNDEFYTREEDIQNELENYQQHFKGKVVYCNCDDPVKSQFFQFFWYKFHDLGLKRLISTSFADSPLSKRKGAFKVELTRGAGQGTRRALQKAMVRAVRANRKPIGGGGDFRSPECVALLKQADVVVTNPPFSLFREYIAQLVEYRKKFLVVGSLNAVTYKEIFPLIASGKLWLGIKHPKIFTLPKGGTKTFGNILWYTNLDHNRRREKLPLWKPYTADEFPKYDNYDAINVDKVSEIPKQYKGAMGVPITFLEKHNPAQFEILGSFNAGSHGEDIGAKHVPVRVNGKVIPWNGPVVGGKPQYKRVIIRSK